MSLLLIHLQTQYRKKTLLCLNVTKTLKGNAQFVQKVTFDGFQTKTFWKFEILQKLLILKVFFTTQLLFL